MAVDEESPTPDKVEAPASQEPEAPGAEAPPAKPPARAARPAPAWVVPLYVGGLLFVYLGERRVRCDTRPGTGSSAGWAWRQRCWRRAALLAALPRGRRAAPHRAAARRCCPWSGCSGWPSYFATTDWGTAKLGLDTAQTVTRERVEGVLTVLWIVLVGVAVVPMLFAEGALYPMRHAEHPESRRVRAAAASGLTLAMVAVYGALFVYAAEGVDLRVDYSYFKTSQAQRVHPQDRQGARQAREGDRVLPRRERRARPRSSTTWAPWRGACRTSRSRSRIGCWCRSWPARSTPMRDGIIVLDQGRDRRDARHRHRHEGRASEAQDARPRLPGEATEARALRAHGVPHGGSRRNLGLRGRQRAERRPLVAPGAAAAPAAELPRQEPRTFAGSGERGARRRGPGD